MKLLLGLIKCLLDIKKMSLNTFKNKLKIMDDLNLEIIEN